MTASPSPVGAAPRAELAYTEEPGQSVFERRATSRRRADGCSSRFPRQMPSPSHRCTAWAEPVWVVERVPERKYLCIHTWKCVRTCAVCTSTDGGTCMCFAGEVLWCDVAVCVAHRKTLTTCQGGEWKTFRFKSHVDHCQGGPSINDEHPACEVQNLWSVIMPPNTGLLASGSGPPSWARVLEELASPADFTLHWSRPTAVGRRLCK